MIDYGVELLNVDDFYSKLDTNCGYVAFKNGLYDIKTAKFRAGFLPEDHIHHTLDYEYEKKNSCISKQIEQVKMLFKKISWNNPFGDGNISHKILRVLKKELKNKKK